MNVTKLEKIDSGEFVMQIKDKYVIGFIAGLLAVIPMDILDYSIYGLLKMLGYTHILYADYTAAAILQGQPSRNLFEFICGQIFHMVHCGLMGSLYIFILHLSKEGSTLFRGWLIGVITWFLAFLTGVMFKIDLFVEAQMHTVLSDLITSSIYGIFLALVLEKLFHMQPLKEV